MLLITSILELDCLNSRFIVEAHFSAVNAAFTFQLLEHPNFFKSSNYFKRDGNTHCVSCLKTIEAHTSKLSAAVLLFKSYVTKNSLFTLLISKIAPFSKFKSHIQYCCNYFKYIICFFEKLNALASINRY